MNLHHELFLHTFGLDRVAIRPPASVATMTCAASASPAPTLEDFLRASERIKDQMAELGGPPERRMKLTRAEFEQLRELCAPHLRGTTSQGLAFPSFNGVDIEIVEPE